MTTDKSQNAREARTSEMVHRDYDRGAESISLHYCHIHNLLGGSFVCSILFYNNHLLDSQNQSKCPGLPFIRRPMWKRRVEGGQGVRKCGGIRDGSG